MPTVLESWDRIHRWLARHAPKILASLNPGATDQEVSSAERTFGMPMPPDWRELYLVQNGVSQDKNLGSLFHGMVFLTLERAVAEFSRDATARKELGSVYTPDAVGAADPGIKRQDMHNGGWIPLAHDGGEVLIRVDLDPAAGGHKGQVICTDHAYAVAILLAPSIGHFLSDFADDLEGGRYSLLPEALEEGNEFLDCAAEIDLSNWWKSPRWRHLEK